MNKAYTYQEWNQSAVTLIAGVAGSGKTNTARYLIAQALMNGVETYVVDPHGNYPSETLTSSLKDVEQYLAAPIAIEKDDRVKTILHVFQILERRFMRGLQQPGRVALFLDETPSHFLECTREEIKMQTTALIRLANEARKIDIRVYLMGQNWKKDFIGARDVRSSATHYFFHRIAQDEVKLFLPSVPASLARLISELPTGQMVVFPELKKVTVPYTPTDEILRVKNRFITPQRTEEPTQDAPRSSQEGSGAIMEAYVKEIIALSAQGLRKDTIIGRVFKTRKGTDRWKAASRFYDKVIEKYG